MRSNDPLPPPPTARNGARPDLRPALGLLALLVLLPANRPAAAQSDLRVLEAVESATVRLPSDGVRGLHWFEDDLWLLVTANRSLSAPDTSYTSHLVRLDPESGLADTLATEQDGYETGLAYDGEFLWSGGSLLGQRDGLYQIETSTYGVTLALPGSGVHPAGLAWDGTHLWQADADARKLYRMDPEEGRISRKVPSPAFYPTGLAYDGFHFWCADASTGRLYRLRGHNGRADAVVSTDAFLQPGEFVSLTWDGRSLWAAAASDSVAVRLELLQ